MNDEATVRDLSVREWHALAEQGANIPVRITVNGWSMQPLIRKGRDPVTILPLTRGIRQGDIVLFSDPARERYVLHRAWQVEESRVLTWGDNCVSPDGWLPVSAIWGLAVQLERGGRTLRLDSESAAKRGMILARYAHWRCRTRVRMCKALRPVLGSVWRRLKAMKR